MKAAAQASARRGPWLVAVDNLFQEAHLAVVVMVRTPRRVGPTVGRLINGSIDPMDDHAKTVPTLEVSTVPRNVPAWVAILEVIARRTTCSEPPRPGQAGRAAP